MGLLDMFGTSAEDPRTAATLQLAAGLLGSRRGGGMQGLLQGLQGYTGTMAQAKEMERRKLLEEEQRRAAAEERGLRMEQLRGAMAEQQQLRQQAAMDQGLLRAQFGEQAGPTQDGLPIKSGAFDPRMMLGQGGSLQGAMQGMQLNQALTPQAPKRDIRALGGSLVEITKDGAAPIYTEAAKPEKMPEALRTLELIHGKDSPQYVAAAQALGRRMTESGQANVRVEVPINLGQKGFDNTLKLRGDFRSEPVYKAHQEMESAYSQIKQALGKASPAGDLAGATKIMKLLDPGSVVRESELGMAMAATGLLDRVGNYADMVIKGTKLTESQRKDFQSLADKLYGESIKQYGNKRGEYGAIAKRNGLNVDDVIGQDPKMPKPVGDAVKRFNPETGRIE